MRPIPRIRRVVPLSIVALCLHAPTAAAQTLTLRPIVGGASRADVAAGLIFEAPKDVNVSPLCGELSVPCISPRTFPDFGATLSIAGHLGDRFAVVGEGDLSRNVWYTYQTTGCQPAGGRVPAECSGQRINHIRSALIGLRARTGPPSPRDQIGVRAFVQFLAGPQWSDVDIRRHVVQPGGGVDVYTHNGVTLRAEVDYCHVPGGPRNLSTARTLVGLVFPIG